MASKKAPYAYYVVICQPKNHSHPKRAKVVKSRTEVPGALFKHELREHALDFQKDHNRRLRNQRKQIENRIRKGHAAVMRAAPAFTAYAKKKLLDEPLALKEKLKEGLVECLGSTKQS